TPPTARRAFHHSLWSSQRPCRSPWGPRESVTHFPCSLSTYWLTAHGWRESNPRSRLWRPLRCHYATPAGRDTKSPPSLLRRRAWFGGDLVHLRHPLSIPLARQNQPLRPLVRGREAAGFGG